MTDEEVLEIARVEGRLLITEDKDFGELVYRLKRDLPGVIMLRLPTAGRESHGSRLKAVIDRHAGKLIGCFTVIDQNKVRFRPLP
jgi:predicted nuclease of predicted toxin-antitoxin system